MQRLQYSPLKPNNTRVGSNFTGQFPPQQISRAPLPSSNNRIISQPPQSPYNAFLQPGVRSVSPQVMAPARSLSPMPRQGYSNMQRNIPLGVQARQSPMMNLPAGSIPLGQPIPVGPVHGGGFPYGPQMGMGVGMGMGMPMQMQIGAPRPYKIPYPPQPSYIGYQLLKQDSNKNNAQSANQWVPNFDATIQESKVFCILCQQSYLSSDRVAHAQKHKRPISGVPIKKIPVQTNVIGQKIPELRPIVQPEEYNIQYNPNQFILQQNYNYSTAPVQPVQPTPPPPPPSPPTVLPTPRSDLGIGTSDPLNQSYTSNYSQVAPVVPGRPSAYQPQSVRLTTDGQTINYVDPNMYQGERIQRESQINPQPVPNTINVNDSRFSRNTFISDQPAPAIAPQYQNNINRQTIQSQNLRNTQNLSGFGDSSIIQPVPNTLPLGPILQSQDFRGSSYDQNLLASGAPRTSTNLLTPSQKIEATHQSVMSPIHEQQSNRQTASIANEQALRMSTSQQQASVRPGTTGYSAQPTQSVRNTSGAHTAANFFQQQLQNQSLNPAFQPSLQNSMQNSMQSSKQAYQDQNILDSFDYGASNTVNNVIPRESRNTTQRLTQIPISTIIGEKGV